MKIKEKIAHHVSFNDLVLVGALLVAGALTWNTVVAMQRNYRLQQKYERLQTEVELQKLANQNLRYQITYLKTDGYLELAAREKFNKAKPGEKLVYLPGSGEAQRSAVARQPKQEKKVERTGWQANLQAWWKFFQGKETAPDTLE